MTNQADGHIEERVRNRIMTLHKKYGEVPYSVIYNDPELKEIQSLRRIIFKLLNKGEFYNTKLDHLYPTEPSLESPPITLLPPPPTDDDLYRDGFDPRNLEWETVNLDSNGNPLKSGPYERTKKNNDIKDSLLLYNYVVRHQFFYSKEKHKSEFHEVFYYGYKYFIMNPFVCRRKFDSSTSPSRRNFAMITAEVARNEELMNQAISDTAVLFNTVVTKTDKSIVEALTDQSVLDEVKKILH